MPKMHSLIFLVAIFRIAVASCPERSQPLLLSPFIERNEQSVGRDLSKVHPDCVESYVPESYAGYLTTNKDKGHHMFFWFFPAAQNRNTAPVLLWLNGGPGYSSMIGLFWEHGPMNVVNRTENINMYEQRTYSWTDHFSMIYVDNPIGTGFSFSETGDELQNVTRARYTEELASFVEQFFQLFPTYKARDFYIGGQSYGGRYAPALAHELHKRKVARRSTVNLKGVYLGSPYLSAYFTLMGYYDFIYAIGVISHIQLTYFQTDVNRQFTVGPVMSYVPQYLVDKYWNNFVTGEGSYIAVLDELLNQNQNLRNGIHIGNRTFHSQNWPLFQQFIANDFKSDNLVVMGGLMDKYKVLIYNGNYDVAISTPTLERTIMNITWSQQQQYNTNTSRTTWNGPSNEVYGFYSQTDKFCRVTVNGAGHNAPKDNPKVVLEVMKHFTKDGCVRVRP